MPHARPADLRQPQARGHLRARRRRRAGRHHARLRHLRRGPGPCFSRSRARQKIFFSPHKTKVAVVTCGGICPGINDVIRSIVMEGPPPVRRVAATLGIRYGLRGFIPAAAHDVLELSPANWPRSTNSAAPSSVPRAEPQAVDEIVDAMDRLGIGFASAIGRRGPPMRAAWPSRPKSPRAAGHRHCLLPRPWTTTSTSSRAPSAF